MAFLPLKNKEKQKNLILLTGNMAGVLGFEPRNAEIKTRCLTAWRYPNYYIDINEMNGAGRGT